MGQETDRNMIVMVVAALGTGILCGLIMAPRARGGNREAKTRTGGNIVFGNIIIGSNNGDSNTMSFGYDDSGDNR